MAGDKSLTVVTTPLLYLLCVLFLCSEIVLHLVRGTFRLPLRWLAKRRKEGE